MKTPTKTPTRIPARFVARAQAMNQSAMIQDAYISVELKTDLSGARRFLERCEVFALAESLGGVESLIEHPAIMTHATIPAAQRAALGITDALVRLSVGIEDVDDLRLDLSHALDVI